MPTDRFYRLPTEKKITIRNAAIKEFARVPIDKVSINKIIKEAEISRGSFYTYFEDKWDVLSYIFEESKERLWEHCFRSLKDSGGDIWFMLEQLLDRILDFCAQEEVFEFIRHVMSHAGSEEFMRGFPKKSPENEYEFDTSQARSLYESYDRKLLKPLSYEEFRNFFQIAMAIIGIEVRAFFGGLPKEKAEKAFLHKLDILRYGVCPNEAESEQQQVSRRKL